MVLRRVLIVLLTLGLAIAPLRADAQPPGKVYRIGMLLHDNNPSDPNRIAFREGLRALGWVEGQNCRGKRKGKRCRRVTLRPR